MDARTFEPDDPLPCVCRHCKWAGNTLAPAGEPVLACAYAGPHTDAKAGHLRPSIPGFKYVSPDHTCEHWEERP